MTEDFVLMQGVYICRFLLGSKKRFCWRKSWAFGFLFVWGIFVVVLFHGFNGRLNIFTLCNLLTKCLTPQLYYTSGAHLWTLQNDMHAHFFSWVFPLEVFASVFFPWLWLQDHRWPHNISASKSILTKMQGFIHNRDKKCTDKIKKCSAGNANTLVWRGFPQGDSLKRDNIPWISEERLQA